MQELWVQSLGWEDLLQKEMAPHSGVLAWEIPRTEKLVGYSPWGHRVGHNVTTEHVCMCECVLVTQSCLTPCDPLDCSPPDYSIHRILQARMLEQVAIPFPKGSSQPRDQTSVSCIAGRFFTVWVTREAHIEKKFPYETWILKNLLFFFPSPVKSFQDPKCMDGSFNTFYFSITVY